MLNRDLLLGRESLNRDPAVLVSTRLENFYPS